MIRIARIVSAVAGTILLAATAAAQSVEIKLGHVGEPGSLFDQTTLEFAKRANAKLGDKGKVVTFGSSQLGGDTELLKKLKLGTVDLALPSTVMTTVAAEFGVFEMPYLVKNRAHAAKIRQSVIKPTLVPIAKAKGYNIIAVWENGFRQITNNRRPIVKPDDLKGIKLRVPKGVWRVRMFQAYGATPSPMALSEVFVALQTGVMDGQENPLAQTYPSRFQEVQKYLSMSGHVYTPAYLTAGRSWSRLAPDVQKVLADTAVEMEPVALEIAARLDDELLGKMKAAGIQVNEVDKAAFVAASKPVYEQFAKEVPGGQKLIDAALALAKD